MVKCKDIVLLCVFGLLAIALLFAAGVSSAPPRSIIGTMIFLYFGIIFLAMFSYGMAAAVGSGHPIDIANIPNDTAYRIKAKLPQTGENNKGVMVLTDKDGPNNKFFLIECDDLSLFPDSVKFVKVQDSELMPYSFEE